MTTIATPDIKRCESFSYEAEIINNGQLLDVPVESVRSQVRTKVGVLLGECVVEKISTGKFHFSITDTNSWPVGQIEFDVSILISGNIRKSNTFTKNVLKDITRPVVEPTPEP